MKQPLPGPKIQPEIIFINHQNWGLTCHKIKKSPEATKEEEDSPLKEQSSNSREKYIGYVYRTR